MNTVLAEWLVVLGIVAIIFGSSQIALWKGRKKEREEERKRLIYGKDWERW